MKKVLEKLASNVKTQYFCIRFWGLRLLWRIKKEFFERDLHKQTEVVQERVLRPAARQKRKHSGYDTNRSIPDATECGVGQHWRKRLEHRQFTFPELSHKETTEDKNKEILQCRVWSWLRMNASYRLNTCKSRGSMIFPSGKIDGDRRTGE